MKIATERNQAVEMLKQEKTERAATKEALEAARKDVEKLRTEIGQLQSENTVLKNQLSKLKLFVAGMLHDARNLLTSISGYTQLLVDYWERYVAGKAQNGKEKAEIVLTTSVRLAELLTFLGDHLKIEAGDFRQKKNLVDVVAELNSVVEILHPVANDKNATVTVRTTKRIMAHLDNRLLHHVATNLITNAIKYNKQTGGTVDITAEADNDHVVIRISDTGIGIPEEHLKRIFDPYHRVEGNHGTKGSGLGLMVVKEFTELMGGTVSVESELGKGSTFTVALPGVPATVTLPDVTTEKQGQD